MKTVCVCKHVNVHMNVYMYVCVLCVHVCACVCGLCVYVFVCACVGCMYVFVCVYAGAIACTQMCEYQRSMLSVFLYPSPF